jgi:hypothetical protein
MRYRTWTERHPKEWTSLEKINTISVSKEFRNSSPKQPRIFVCKLVSLYMVNRPISFSSHLWSHAEGNPISVSSPRGGRGRINRMNNCQLIPRPVRSTSDFHRISLTPQVGCTVKLQETKTSGKNFWSQFPSIQSVGLTRTIHKLWQYLGICAQFPIVRVPKWRGRGGEIGIIKELRNLNSPPCIIRITEPGRMTWAVHVVRMGIRVMRIGFLCGNPDRKIPVGRSRRGWKNNIKLDLDR